MTLPLAFGFSTSEIVLILAVALLLFGGKKLPELARSMGRSVNEFKRGMQEVTTEVTSPGDPVAKTDAPAAPAAPETPAPQSFKFDPHTGKPLNPDNNKA